MYTTILLIQLCFLYQYGVSGIPQGVSCIPPGQNQCKHIHNYDFNECSEEMNFEHLEHSEETPPCKNDNICRKNFNVTLIEMPPFSFLMEKQVTEMLEHCCGECATITNVKIGTVFNVNSTWLNSSDMIFPVFGKSSAHKLHDFWFMPFFDVPSAKYVIKKKTDHEVTEELMTGIGTLWPLLCIGLILPFLAGFIVWVGETWVNEDEFSRSFFIGLFDGYWWAYVSMTTVGYGDKVTRSRLTRIFSVVWILIGITIFSMLIASLTNIISAVDSDPSTDLTGKTVGVLKHRIYDATLAAKHGGIVQVSESADIMSAIDSFYEKLFLHALDGFLVDKLSLHFYSSRRPHINLGNLLQTDKLIDGERLSYGILIKEHSVYHYLEKYVLDNWFQLDTCRQLYMNQNLSKGHTLTDHHGGGGLYSTEGGLFYPTLMYSCIALAVILLFGLFYELRRTKGCRQGNSNQNQVNAE